MKREVNPVGQWYLRPDTQELFQVVDWDDFSGTLQIQMFDGTLDEIERDTWRSLSAEPVEPPEDWTGPLDNVEVDDLQEFASESDAQPQEYFRDDRESWESLLDEEPMGVAAQQLHSEGELHEPQQSRRPPSQRAVPLRASG